MTPSSTSIVRSNPATTTLRQALGLLQLCLVLALAACSSTVVRQGGSAAGATASQPKYGASATVSRGDTLYRIASSNGVSALDLATWNRIPPPYTIYPGQRLKLYPGNAGGEGGGTRIATGKPTRLPSSSPAKTTAPTAAAVAPASSSVRWQWPTEGQLVASFADNEPTRQGIDIAGQGGQPVRAAGDGVVVYSGSGLVGYGELIIVKHDEQWLSAYGHNRERLVNEGQRVSAGQQIALMGRSGAARDLLHFEIRYNGKPVNPLAYLPRK